MILATRRRKVYALLIGLLVCIIAIVTVWVLSGNQATITPATSHQATSRVGDKDFDGTYMTFRYSGNYLAQPLQAQAPDLESYLFTADTNYPKHLAVSVTSGTPASSSAYILRQSQPGIYSYHQQMIGGSLATIWIKADNTEQTIFIPHGDHFALLSFSIANTNATNQLAPEVDKVLTSFQWK